LEAATVQAIEAARAALYGERLAASRAADALAAARGRKDLGIPAGEPLLDEAHATLTVETHGGVDDEVGGGRRGGGTFELAKAHFARGKA
jgi:hypothetical protein